MSQTVLFDSEFEQSEVKSHRWITLDEQKEWISWLKSTGLGGLKGISDDRLEWCASVVEKYNCQANHKHSIHTKYLLCGNRTICPRCAMSYANKKSQAQYMYLKENFAKNLPFDSKINQIVLTLPKKLHSTNKKLFSKMIKDFMNKMGIEAYGYVIQDRHSKDPLSKKYAHAHCITLNVKEQDGYLIQNDYYFDLDGMRDIWKQVIQKNLNYEVKGFVNLFTEYASIINEPQKVKHILKYVYRYPIEDLFNVQVRNHSINYLEKGHFKNLQQEVFSLLSDKKSKFVWCGLLSSGKRKYLTNLLEMPHRFWQNLVYYEKEIERRSKLCRDCGMQLEDKPFEVCDYNGDNEPELFKPPILAG